MAVQFERNINLDPNWSLRHGYKYFKDDMYESYLEAVEKYGEENISIDRIDNDKGYYKENCRWTISKVQANNRRTNRSIEYNGLTYNSIQSCLDTLNFSKYDQRKDSKYIVTRLRCGWSVKEAINIPPLGYGYNKEKWYKDHNINETDLPDIPIRRPIHFDKSLINPNYDFRKIKLTIRFDNDGNYTIEGE